VPWFGREDTSSDPDSVWKAFDSFQLKLNLPSNPAEAAKLRLSYLAVQTLQKKLVQFVFVPEILFGCFCWIWGGVQFQWKLSYEENRRKDVRVPRLGPQDHQVNSHNTNQHQRQWREEGRRKDTHADFWFLIQCAATSFPAI